MAIVRNPKSWLKFCKLYVIEDTRFWGLAGIPEIDSSPDDVLYELQVHDRLDNLAFRFYKDPRYEWIIKRINGIRVWPFECPPGTILRIPRLSRMIDEGVIRVGGK